MSLFLTIVLDGVGIGAQPDASEYGDEGSHTLGHVCQAMEPQLPNLSALGLGWIEPLTGVPEVETPRAHFGKMSEASAGKDSTTGHWELAGLYLNEPFPTYDEGFPEEVIDDFVQKTGCGGILGNVPASGTAIIARHGEAHIQNGYPIIYTSADSVLQVAAHKEVIPLDDLYRICEIARREVCVGEHAVGRVIARPFVGKSGAFSRVSAERRDFSVPPDKPTLQLVLQQHGVHTVSIGKVADLFGGVGFDRMTKTKSNADGVQVTISRLQDYSPQGPDTFIWTNLVDFDQDYGHRNDAEGFARALEEFDRALPDIKDNMPSDAHLVITADHGNDPTTTGTDHNREYVPLLYVSGSFSGIKQDLGTRSSFTDHAATVAEFFQVPFDTQGTSFLQE